MGWELAQLNWVSILVCMSVQVQSNSYLDAARRPARTATSDRNFELCILCVSGILGEMCRS